MDPDQDEMTPAEREATQKAIAIIRADIEILEATLTVLTDDED